MKRIKPEGKRGHKYHTINYVDGHTVDKSGHLDPIYKKEKITLSATKRYHACLFLLFGLSQCARNLMDWLAEEMDGENMVYNNHGKRQQFIDFASGITSGKIVYKDQTVRKSFVELDKAGLLVQHSRGCFLVNPKYFFKYNNISEADERKRSEMIMMEIEINSKNTDFKVFWNV